MLIVLKYTLNLHSLLKHGFQVCYWRSLSVLKVLNHSMCFQSQLSIPSFVLWLFFFSLLFACIPRCDRKKFCLNMLIKTLYNRSSFMDLIGVFILHHMNQGARNSWLFSSCFNYNSFVMRPYIDWKVGWDSETRFHARCLEVWDGNSSAALNWIGSTEPKNSLTYYQASVLYYFNSALKWPKIRVSVTVNTFSYAEDLRCSQGYGIYRTLTCYDKDS